MDEELESTKEKQKKKPEDFVGEIFNNGKLRVIGIHGKGNRYQTLYRVTCTECSKDKELFPEGYFISTKGNLLKGQIPCGCAKSPRWEGWQWLLRARRAAEGRFKVIGFVEGFKNQKSRVICECIVDGYIWTPTVNCVVNMKGCPRCYGNERKTEEQALLKCVKICQEMSYEAIGFPEGFKNAYSRFEYKCQKHGTQNVSYHCFVNKESRCPICWREKQKEIGGFYGLYQDRLEDPDFLYVLSVNDGEYIKVGRTFDLEGRLGTMKYKSQANTRNIKLLRMFTGKHLEVWNLEQELHNRLKTLGFQFHHKNWNSVELFKFEAITILNELLSVCSLEEIH